MMRHSLLLAFVLSATALSSSARAAIVAQSTFDANHDNWTATFGANNSSSATFNAADGVPPGSLRSSDRPDLNFTWYFQSSNSPGTTFYGDKSAAYGHALTYDLKRFADPGAEYYVESGAAVYHVRLTGVVDTNNDNTPDTSLTLGFANLALTPTTTSAWEHFNVPLMASAGWVRDTASADPPALEQDLMGVLLNLRHIEIRGNYSLPIGDSTGLDNVTLTPEPSSFVGALVLGALAGGFSLRSRRRRATAR
jgi:hypothetical protein